MPIKTQEKQSESLRVQILNDQGKLGFNNEVFMVSDESLLHLLQLQTEPLILIDAENSVSTQSIVSLIDYLNMQGFEKVSLGNTFELQSMN
jgi:biopolymer transport protein ExbD